MSRSIAVRLLGPVELTIDGAPPPAELLWRKHLALCLVLWLAPGRRRTRDQLVGLLWAEKDDRAAKHSLNEALRVIRRAAGDQALDSGPDGVAWTAPIALDLDRFNSLERDSPEAAAALVAGPFADGFVVAGADAFEQWLEAERTRWQHRSVAVLCRSSAAAEDRGDSDGALRASSRAVAINPWSESATVSLIRAHWLAGDRTAALEAGAAFGSRVTRELGAEVSPAVTALVRRIERERRAPKRGATSTPDRRAPLIARDELLGKLIAVTGTAAEAGKPALLVVNGPGGAGRTRIFEELTGRAIVNGSTVVAMRALDVDGADPHGAVAALGSAGLHDAPGVAAAPTAAIAAFAARSDSWADRYRDAAKAEPTPVREAFAAIVRATAGDQAIMLAIDDADRLNPDEVRWLLALMREVGGLPVTLLLTVNSDMPNDAVDEVMRSVGRDIAGVALRLEPWTLGDIEALVAESVRWDAAAGARLARRLFAESAGSPSIAVELLGAVMHGLSLDQTWPAADRTLDASLPAAIPESLVAAIRLAHRRLPPDAREVLSIAALLDEPFSAERVARIAGHADAASTNRSLDALEWERWIAADGRGYSFPARVRRRLVAEEMMTPGQRRRLRDRIAACP